VATENHFKPILQRKLQNVYLAEIINKKLLVVTAG
jgi:hypothetical protein